MDAAAALPRAYAAWRRRTLAAALAAAALGAVAHGPTGEVRYDLGAGWPSPWLAVGLVVLVGCSLGPGVVGTGLALAGLGAWRRLGPSSRLARAAWVVWVLGPLPVLLLPVSHAFALDAEDALRTSTRQVRYLVTVTAPALLGLFPGVLAAALVLERFLPESRAPGYVTLLAAPACAAAYLFPLGVLAQLAFHPEPYAGLLLLAGSPVVPLVAARRLLRRNTPEQAARLVRAVGVARATLAALGVALLAGWAGEYPQLRAWLGRVDPVWVLGVVTKVLAGRWLTTVVATDLLVTMLHQGREAARTLAGSAEGAALTRKLDALGAALRPGGPKGPV